MLFLNKEDKRFHKTPHITSRRNAVKLTNPLIFYSTLHGNVLGSQYLLLISHFLDFKYRSYHIFNNTPSQFCLKLISIAMF